MRHFSRHMRFMHGFVGGYLLAIGRAAHGLQHQAVGLRLETL